MHNRNRPFTPSSQPFISDVCYNNYITHINNYRQTTDINKRICHYRMALYYWRVYESMTK